MVRLCYRSKKERLLPTPQPYITTTITNSETLLLLDQGSHVCGSVWQTKGVQKGQIEETLAYTIKKTKIIGSILLKLFSFLFLFGIRRLCTHVRKS